MFNELVQNYGGKIDAPISIQNEIDFTLRQCPGNALVIQTVDSVGKNCKENGIIRKSELLSIWRDPKAPFASKCLATLWWGKPYYTQRKRVYSESNLQKLQDGKLEKELSRLHEEANLTSFKHGLEDVFRRLSRGGDLHMDGINTSFFTKFFHFYFTANPPKADPSYLPVIADSIMLSAVFSEIWNRGESVEEVFRTRAATLCSYVAYTDRFNTYANDLGIAPFTLEDILFNGARNLGRIYVAGYDRRLRLPHWIAGRYNGQEEMAIVFNNLKGETYLFEGPAARLWNELLKYDYEEGFRIHDLCTELGCSQFDLFSFMAELVEKKIVIDHEFRDKELAKIRKTVNKSKARFLKSSNGVGNYHSAYESVDNDYRNRVNAHGIPFAATIELTYACNEACIHCYNPCSPREGEMETQKIVPAGEMRAEEYFPILDSMAKMGVAKLVLTGGDPFMKKDFMSILRYAHKLKFAVSIYTNGQALYAKPELYKEMKATYPQYVGLSLYSTIPEVHDGITRRKGSCEKTMAVAKWCFDDALGLQLKCPIMQANKDSYERVYDFAIQVNGMPQFDVNITSGVDGDCFASQNLRLNAGQLGEILKDARIPLSIENAVGVIERCPEMCFCGAGDSSFNLQPDGILSPCPAFPLNCGDVRKQGFESVWKDSKALQKVRALRYKDSDICGKEEFCKYCNRCIGQSFVEHGVAENHCEDNCFIAKIRYDIAQK